MTSPTLILVNESLVHHGDCLTVLRTLPDASVDSIVTDPPYELGFMGKSWDSTGIAYNTDLWRECLRVLKPGGHVLAFSATRTVHRMTVAIEDAGFEIRDSIQWIYASGFPKSLDVSKAIDNAAGQVRHDRIVTEPGTNKVFQPTQRVVRAGTPVTDEAVRWEGWGTALKPAHEPIVLARKPFTGTVANTVIAHGTGALNIDGCRIDRDPSDVSHAGRRTATFGTQETVSGGDGSGGWEQNDVGRWPANVIFDEDAAEELGPAARYFYCAKPSKAERNAGLEHLDERVVNEVTPPGSKGANSPRAGAGRNGATRNFHPTVKPIELMRYLIRLVTPPGGVVLEPFAGSGTTLVAAELEGARSIGIEMAAEYLPIIEGRLRWASQQPRQLSTQEDTP